VRDVQVLCPMNRGSLGARTLNIELQRALNPPGAERVGWTFCPGDKVMQVANDYERDVFNGDLGLITALDMEEGALTVSFEGRAVEYGFGELDELVLAYATTIHKAQGSEYPVVVIPLATQHYAMLARNLLYTGVTRGKQLVVIVGQQKALAMAVRNNGARRRWTKLREWMRPDPSIGPSRHVSSIAAQRIASPAATEIATNQVRSALSPATQQEAAMTTPTTPPDAETDLPPGVPKPPSKADLDQISKDQALITDEWAPAPAPSPSPSPKTDAPS